MEIKMPFKFVLKDAGAEMKIPNFIIIMLHDIKL